MTVSGGAFAAMGNLALILFNADPGETQTEGSNPLFTVAEAPRCFGQINLTRKVTNSNCHFLSTEDSSYWLINTHLSTSLFAGIISLNEWDVTGSENFDIIVDYERLED